MMRRIERDNTGLLRPGQELVAAGYAGQAGVRVILQRRHRELRQWFSEEYLETAKLRTGPESGLGMDFWRGLGAAECEEAGEGGILAAIWNLSGAYETGVEFALRRIPVTQETIEICERFELNPYRLYSSGCYLLAAENGGRLAADLAERGIPAQVVGKVNRGIKREVIHAESRGFLDRPQKDELRKVVPDYFGDGEAFSYRIKQGGNQQ